MHPFGRKEPKFGLCSHTFSKPIVLACILHKLHIFTTCNSSLAGGEGWTKKHSTFIKRNCIADIVPLMLGAYALQVNMEHTSTRAPPNF